MNALLGAESLKLRSLRGTWVITAVLALVSGAIGVAEVTARAPGVALPSLAELVLSPARPAWFLVIVLAVLASAGEFQHRTVRTTLLAAPRRMSVLLAKAAVAAKTGILLVVGAAVVTSSAALVTALVTGGAPSIGTAHDWAAAVGAVGLGALWAVLATGLGMLTRSTAAAISAVLLWRFVGEVIIPMLARDPGVSRWTPSGAADAVIGLGGTDVLPVLGATVLLLAYAAAVCGAAGLLFTRSDPA